MIYRPSNKGRGAVVMTDLAALEPGTRYKVARIDRGQYVVVEGHEDAVGGGLYWTEFSAE